MNREGFTSIVILGIIALVLASGFVGYLIWKKPVQSGPPQNISPTTQQSTPTPTTPITTTTASSSTGTSASIHISAIYPDNVRAGDRITIAGFGFAPTNNEVKFSGLTIGKYSSNDGKSIAVQIPASVQEIPNCRPDELCPEHILTVFLLGTYQVTVTNGSKISNPFPLEVDFAAKSSNPEILSIDAGKDGLANRLAGTNFTLADNKIYLGSQLIGTYNATGHYDLWGLLFDLPTGAAAGDYSLYLVNGNGQKSNEVNFVIQPFLHSLSTSTGPVGTEVLIQGLYLTGPKQNSVLFVGQFPKPPISVPLVSVSPDHKTAMFAVPAVQPYQYRICASERNCWQSELYFTVTP